MLLVRPGRVSSQTPNISLVCLEPHLRRLTQKSEILATLQLIEAYIGFDGGAGPRIAEVGIIARYDGKAFSFGLPGEVCHGVWGKNVLSIQIASDK